MGYLLMLLGVLAFLVAVLGLIVGLVMRMRKQPLKTWQRWPTVIGAFIGSVVLIGLGGVFFPSTADPTPPAVVEKPKPQPKAETPKPQPAAEPEEPTAPQGKRIMIGEFLVGCRNAVKEQLKSPSTAKFPGTFESNDQARETEQGERVWAGYVDSQNALGAVLRTNFVCTYDPLTEQYVANLQ